MAPVRLRSLPCLAKGASCQLASGVEVALQRLQLDQQVKPGNFFSGAGRHVQHDGGTAGLAAIEPRHLLPYPLQRCKLHAGPLAKRGFILPAVEPHRVQQWPDFLQQAGQQGRAPADLRAVRQLAGDHARLRAQATQAAHPFHQRQQRRRTRLLAAPVGAKRAAAKGILRGDAFDQFPAFGKLIEHFQLLRQRRVRIAQDALDLLAGGAPFAIDETQQAVAMGGQRLSCWYQVELPGAAADLAFQPRLQAFQRGDRLRQVGRLFHALVPHGRDEHVGTHVRRGRHLLRRLHQAVDLAVAGQIHGRIDTEQAAQQSHFTIQSAEQCLQGGGPFECLRVRMGRQAGQLLPQVQHIALPGIGLDLARQGGRYALQPQAIVDQGDKLWCLAVPAGPAQGRGGQLGRGGDFARQFCQIINVAQHGRRHGVERQGEIGLLRGKLLATHPQGRDARHQPLDVIRQYHLERHAAPWVVLRLADIDDALRQFLDHGQALLHFVGRPCLRLLQPDIDRFHIFMAQLAQFTDDLVGRQPGGGVPLVQARAVRVELIARRQQAAVQGGGRVALGRTQFRGAAQLVEKHLLVGLVAVQLDAGVADAGLVQAPLDHFQRGHFFRHEQHRLAVRNRRGNHIGNRLRFAGAGRTLYHQIAPGPYIVHGQGLRAVAIDDMQQLGRRDMLIQIGVFRYRRFFKRETIGQQPAHQRLIRQPALRPGGRIEVAVHEELGKGKKAEHDIVAIDHPAILGFDGVANGFNIGQRIEFVARFIGRHFQMMHAFEKRFQRQIRGVLFLAPFQFELFGGVTALQADRYQYQRRMAHILCIERIEPFQGAQRQEQNIDALLFLQRARVEIHVEQAFLQPF